MPKQENGFVSSKLGGSRSGDLTGLFMTFNTDARNFFYVSHRVSSAALLSVNQAGFQTAKVNLKLVVLPRNRSQGVFRSAFQHSNSCPLVPLFSFAQLLSPCFSALTLSHLETWSSLIARTIRCSSLVSCDQHCTRILTTASHCT